MSLCSNPDHLDCIYTSGCSYNSTWAPLHTSVFSSPSKEMCCCLCKGRPGTHHSYLARCTASVFFANSTGGNGSCHLHFAADVAGGCIPDARAVLCLSPANLANHSQFPNITGPVCPANPAPTPPPLPCTIEPLPPAPSAPKRWASYWASVPQFLNGTNTDAVTKLIALLKANGGNATVTSLIIGCGDTIDANGTFVDGESEGCASAIPQLNAMGVGAELTISASAAGLRKAFQNPDPVIAALVAKAKTQKLRGWGSDWEYTGTVFDGQGVTCFQAKLRAALRSVDTRLTMFNDDFDGFISDLPDLQHSVDRLLEGDTYWYWPKGAHRSHNQTDAQNLSSWISLGYDHIVNTAIDRQKVGIALIGATDGGIWNCEESSMALRFAQAAKDNVPEVSIFILRTDEPGCNDSGQCPGPNVNSTWPGHKNVDGMNICACSNKYFPYTKAWLAGKLVFPPSGLPMQRPAGIGHPHPHSSLV